MEVDVGAPVTPDREVDQARAPQHARGDDVGAWCTRRLRQVQGFRSDQYPHEGGIGQVIGAEITERCCYHALTNGARQQIDLAE